MNSVQPTSETRVYSLSQVARSIRLALERATANKQWLIRAEIVGISDGIGRKAVYLDLVEESEGRQNAKMRAIIWANAGQRILEELGQEAHQILQVGSEVVFSARIQFHERYGLALHIDRIDLRFMLGELERRKQATIERLKELGATEWNRRLPAPFLPQRIALIGSKGTSGFRDFVIKSLEHPNRYRIQLDVFESSVQGLSAAEELVAALKKAQAENPDLIVLVRGGGGKLDLDAYNDYNVCLAIAQSTVPVWTGIGHESDWVVADLVAQRPWKTPTEVAVGVTECFEAAEFELDQVLVSIERMAREWILARNNELEAHWTTIQWAGKQVIGQHRAELKMMQKILRVQAPAYLAHHQQMLLQWRRRLVHSGQSTWMQSARELHHIRVRMAKASENLVQQHRVQLNHFTRTLHALGPEQTLQRGFMLLERDGRVLSGIRDLHPGDSVQVRAKDGELNVTVDSVKTSDTPP